MLIVMTFEGRGSIRNLQETKRREEDIIHLIQRVPQILRQNHLNLIVILTHICHHPLTLVLQVMTGVKRGRELLNEKNIGVEKEEIDDVIKREKGAIRDQSVDQEGFMLIILHLSFIPVSFSGKLPVNKLESCACFAVYCACSAVYEGTQVF